MDNRTMAAHVVELARRAGAEQCDVILRAYDESEVTVRLGETEKLIEAGSRSLGLRVINGGRTAVCATSDLGEDSLEQLARDAVELALISAPDEFAGLPDPAQLARPGADALQLYDEHLGNLTTDEKIRMAKACEAAAFAFDPRISNSDGASLSTRIGEVALANSFGFVASYPATSVSLMVEVMADDEGGKKRNAYWFSSERSLHRLLAPEEVGRIAARRALDQLGARKLPTKQVPVVFEPMMASRLLGDLAGCVTGSALYRGATFLAKRLGEPIGSALVTITDDPSEPGRSGSRPFDGEGVGSRRTAIFEAGAFRAFLFDCYTARRTGNQTTGSASRGVEGLPSPGPSNLILQAGAAPPEAIIAGVREGLYLTTLMGQGFNPTTGDFSRGAGGFWIEDGRVSFPVTEVNVSGRMDTMLAGIDAVGDDLTWFGNVATPTVRIREMTVSGL
ncbi:MAG: TldD/PmbA family protein [Chloroflexi bacterium]|nr:TldD/PmbA family protein [Chloroflexota bacterium]